jgi:RNA polymerase sigma-70 factor, ECF subfamily
VTKMTTVDVSLSPPAAHLPANVAGNLAPEFRAIFESELGYVWNALRRLGVPERDRSDVAHEVFVAVHRHLASYDPSRPVRPWLFAFAFRCASAYRRAARNRFETFSEKGVNTEELAPDPAPPVDDALGARALLAKALLHLDEDKRALVIMHELEGWPVAEIAHALGVPVQTIYSRIRAAREELTTILRRLGLQEGRRSEP